MLRCKIFGHRWKWLNVTFHPKPLASDQPSFPAFLFATQVDYTQLTKLCRRCADIETFSLPGEITLDQLQPDRHAKELSDLERMVQ